MADLGDLLGSLMSGLIRARRVADEQTAAIAEYYKDNPLLEGLSIPRVRVPELTIDMPFLIEGQVEGEIGVMEQPKKIVAAAESQLKATLSDKDIKVNPDFHKEFVRQVKEKLARVNESGIPVMRETIALRIQDAFVGTLAKTKTTLTFIDKETITKDLRSKISTIALTKKPVAPGIIANIKTSEVKERASDINVVRLKITMKEEGLEWAVHASESGGVVRTLQPE